MHSWPDNPDLDRLIRLGCFYQLGPDNEHSEQITHMVNSFLCWKLPKDFQPDGGIHFDADAEPLGTNLLTADQAEEMVRFMMDGLPSSGTEERYRRYLVAAQSEVYDLLAEAHRLNELVKIRTAELDSSRSEHLKTQEAYTDLIRKHGQCRNSTI